MPIERKCLLTCIQAVDADDPLMGFFITWLEEAAQRFTHITVLALRVGRYALPANVTVVPLRPVNTDSRLVVIKTLLKESWLRRHAYDAVFVRGDPHYVLLAGWLWRLLGKRIVFWYAHWKVSIWAVFAHAVAHVTTASVKAAFDHPWIAPVYIGQNVDHTRFSTPEAPRGGKLRCLTFGSIRPNKKIDVALQAFLKSGGENYGTLTIIGPPTDERYVSMLREMAVGHPGIGWEKAVAYDQVPEALLRYDLMINACTGSLDKVILEGMMSGEIVISSTPGVQDWLPTHLQWLYARSEGEIIVALEKVFALTPEARWRLGLELRALAIKHHSLQQQLEKLEALL